MKKSCESKRCSKCKQIYPVSAFYSHKSRPDRLAVQCKYCMLAYSKSDAGRKAGGEAAKRYRESEMGKLCRRKYAFSDAGNAAVKRWRNRYYHSIVGYLHCRFYNARARCENPGIRNYKNYGGRGIKMKFKSADVLVDYVVNVLKVDPRGLDMDRTDNDGNYEPGNIRFVTRKENTNNRKKR